MKTLFTTLLILFATASLYASSESVEYKKENCAQMYPLKIIFGNYSIKENADAVLKKFQKDDAYEKLDALAKENDFKVHTRSSSCYNILVIEPIANAEVRKKVMDIMKPKFEDVYSACAKLNKKNPCIVSKIEDAKEMTKAEEVKNAQEVKNVEEVKAVENTQSDENVLPPQLQETQKIATPKLQVEDVKVEESSIFERYLWLIILAIVSALVLGYAVIRSNKTGEGE
jgi:hypothetical protein